MEEPLRPIDLVTTWQIPCGIAEHSSMLVEAVEGQSDLRFHITSDLSPNALLDRTRLAPVVHLNYHAGLHSQWHPSHVRAVQARGSRVLVTFHDTGVPNSDQCKALHAVADAFVIHEPAEDLPGAHYIRMGVPTRGPARQHVARYDQGYRPILGSIGFPFGWKNYDQLAKITGRLGWQLKLIAPTASAEQIAHWQSFNPHLEVWTDFVPRQSAISLLAGCDATAFTYVCHNTGQSAALLQGIAACKPVHALSTCRQFRALALDPLGQRTIRWAETFEEIEYNLWHSPIMPVDPPTLALATAESWANKAQQYIAIYKELLG